MILLQRTKTNLECSCLSCTPFRLPVKGLQMIVLRAFRFEDSRRFRRRARKAHRKGIRFIRSDATQSRMGSARMKAEEICYPSRLLSCGIRLEMATAAVVSHWSVPGPEMSRQSEVSAGLAVLATGPVGQYIIGCSDSAKKLTHAGLSWPRR